MAEKEGRDGDDYRPDMPPVKGPTYLIDHLFEIGPTMAAGMGDGPITYLEILAWMVLTWTWLWPREVRLLRRLSRDYLKESRKESVQPPWQAPDVKPQPTETQLAIRALANL